VKMIIGHQRIWQFLIKSVESNRIAHAYLFVGSSGIGKKKIAIEFVKLLQCQNRQNSSGASAPCQECRNCLLIERNQHPDVLLIEPNQEGLSINEEGQELSGKPVKTQEIKIEQIRSLQHQISLSPYSGKHKIVIIDSAEQMTQEAANCLLKTLEEPSQKSVLILISSDWHRLLPTIISRCQTIKFLPVKNELVIKGLEDSGIKNRTKILQAARFACGRPGVALKIINEPGFLTKNIQLVEELEELIKKNLAERFKYAKDLAQNSSNATETLDQWVIWLRDQLLFKLGNEKLAVLERESFKNIFSIAKISEAVRNIQEAQKLLGDSSFNARLILENLMLKI